MATTTITSKGQIVIPKPIRDHLHLQSGDRIEFVVQNGGEVVVRPLDLDARDLKGILHKPGRKAVSLRAMERAIRTRGGRVT